MSQGLLVWAVLALVLFGVGTGHSRFELLALAGLLGLGVLGLAPPTLLFSGFGHPALATIVSLSVVSQAISASGVLTGLGWALEHRLKTHHGQILGLSLVAAGLSAFMSNVGAVAILLPTSTRMAGRAQVAAGKYALPIVLASIVGGTVTLAGSAPNVIVSGYRVAATGRPFGFFDYAPHGIAILVAGFLLLLLWGRRLVHGGRSSLAGDSGPAPAFQPFATRERRLCLGILVLAVAAVSFGLVAPAVGFALAAVLMVFSGVIDTRVAYRAIDLRVVLFLGSMLGISRVLEETGALTLLIGQIAPVAALLPGMAVLGVAFASSCLLSNVLGNAAAAAVMAPVALTLGGAPGATAGVDGLLMAVAAGSCLAVILPTHQAVLMALSVAPFSTRELRDAGSLLVLAGGVSAVLVISAVWR